MVVWRGEYPSAPQTKGHVVEAILQASQGTGWFTEEDLGWLQLCLDEAVMNAMVHGNEADDQESISVVLGRDGDRWVIQVHDRGDGFRLAEIPDPDGADALEREHGRGIHLMREWLDVMAYHRSGATLVMAKDIAVRA